MWKQQYLHRRRMKEICGMLGPLGWNISATSKAGLEFELYLYFCLYFGCLPMSSGGLRFESKTVGQRYSGAKSRLKGYNRKRNIVLLLRPRNQTPTGANLWTVICKFTVAWCYLIFHSEDGSRCSLRTFGIHLLTCTAPHPKRQ